jgi:hypothetical protein
MAEFVRQHAISGLFLRGWRGFPRFSALEHPDPNDL